MAQSSEKNTASPPVSSRSESLAVGQWILDPTRSTLEFNVRHFWGLMTVRGRFPRFEGKATVADIGAIAVEVTIDATSVDSKQKQRDKHLRSAHFFDVESHPTVTFSSKQVSLLGPDRLRVEGDLTAAGHSQPVRFEARLTPSSERLAVDATVNVDRTAFGMTWSPFRMAALTVQTAVHAEFTLEKNQ